MERTAWRQTAVKDSSSAVARAWLWRRSARAAAVSLRSAAAALARQRDRGAHPGDDVPARVQDRRDQLMAGEIPAGADDAAGEQVRAAARQPLQQRLLPGPR